MFASLAMLTCAFEFIQLLLEMLKETSTIQSIIPNLMWFCNYPINISVILVFLNKKEALLSYFEDWAKLEREINPSDLPSSIKRSHRRLYNYVYVVYACQSIGLPVVVSVITLNKLDASYLLSYYPILRDTLGIPVIVIFHMISIAIGAIYVAHSNLVPAWVFYHSGIMLESLAIQVESQSSFDKRLDLKVIQRRFENICQLTERASRLFGFLIVLDHISTLFVTCVLSYTTLSRISGADREVIFYFMGLIMFLGRFIIPVLMTAHLRTGYDRLRKAVVGLLSNSESNPKKVNKVTVLLTQIKEAQSAARPLNLYDITPSTLISFASLTVSYVIVLLQSK